MDNTLAHNKGDTTFPMTRWAHSRLWNMADEQGRGTGCMARRLVRRFLVHAKYVQYDFSKLKFINNSQPADLFMVLSLDIEQDDVFKLCRAGRFSPDKLLEVAVSLEGLKQ